MLVPLSSALSNVDAAVANMGICSGFVFAVPCGGDTPEACDLLLGNLYQATKRVVSKWTLLQGRLRWMAEDANWAIDISEAAISQERPFLYTTCDVSSAYAKAVGLQERPEPLSRTAAPTIQSEPKYSFFRHDALPNTISGYAKTGASLLAVHVTRFADAVAVGLSAPHGVFDATGLGFAVMALASELRKEAWVVPESHSLNILDKAISTLPSASIGQFALAGWSPATNMANIFKFIANYAFEKLWHRDHRKFIFLSEQVVENLVRAVKSEVACITEGRGWVSRSDVLTAWTLRNAHLNERGRRTSVAGSAVYSLRKMLSLSQYPHNAIVPYPLTPSPISLDELSSMSVAELAVQHRQALEQARTPTCAKATVKAMQSAPLIPEHSWPMAGFAMPHSPYVFRWMSSNQTASGVARLSLPFDAWGLEQPYDQGIRVADTLAYYMLVVSAIKDHQVFRFQANSLGVFLEGSMRRQRWCNIEAALQALEQSLSS